MKPKPLHRLAILATVAVSAGPAAQAVDISETPLCGAAASVAANAVRLSAHSLIYQTRYSAADWSGRLLALPVGPDGSLGAPLWDAAALIPAAASRNIFTCDPAATGGCGKRFTWDQLSVAQRAALNRNTSGTFDNKGQARLGYLRGDRGNEAPSGEGFRVRNTVLGDIVNSDPLFVGKQDFGFGALPGSEGGSYAAYRRSPAYQSRPGMVYVGANDGMLHAFDAATGVEHFAYVPHAAYGRLSLLTDPHYNQNHKYLVDGSGRAVDAYIGGAWHTVLLGGLGAGGRGVFALRVTDPAHFGAGDVLWEFSDLNDADMGISIPQPSIARMNNGRWAAIVANGYNSARQRAVLLIIDLETGALVKKIDTGVGGDNGLSSPIPVDADADRITDFIYAGDLKGNLWKFDVTDVNPKQWAVAFQQGATPQPLFSACATRSASCSADTQQAITARPEVGLNPRGGFVVYFGTGRYIAATDASVTTPVNSFYGIFDSNGKETSRPQAVGAGRSPLLQQQVLDTRTISGEGFSERVRITTNHRPADAHLGWYLDLPDRGERQISTPLLRGGRIAFTTLAPNADSCGSGGTGWFMELDAFSGSRLGFSPFDLNRDQQFNIGDFAAIAVNGQEVRVPASARQFKEGGVKTPAVIASGGIEYQYAGGATGGIEAAAGNNAGASGRQSRRELR